MAVDADARANPSRHEASDIRMGLSRFFIERPIFASVIAIVIMLAGGFATLTPPIAQYPSHRAARRGR